MDSSQHSDSFVGERPNEAGEPPNAAPQTALPALRTPPPPEWLAFQGPLSVASLALDRVVRGEAVPRRSGSRAELEWLSARRAAANAARDAGAEAALSAALARALAARGAELDHATRLARRALLLADDAELREELAGWFTVLGEPALAAATLRTLLASVSGARAAELLARIGGLLARAGEAHAAREVFEQALSEAPDDAEPAEIAAAIGGWAPDAVPPIEAAGLYLEASDRRERRGEHAQAFEDLIRAFEVAPASAAVADRLAQVLLERGRPGASDEVRRVHARHAGEGARAVHLRRLRDAELEGDLPRALGAALDARLDAELDLGAALGAVPARDARAEGSALMGFDELLERLGLFELLAARLELACDQLSGSERSRARLALGRWCAGPLGRPDRAVDAWIDALVADPANDEARQALLRHAAITRDHTPLVEALVRVGESAVPTVHAERVACLRELLALAEEHLQDANLALWAAQRLRKIAGDDPELLETIERLEPRAHAVDEALELSLQSLEHATGDERIEALKYATSVLLSRPASADTLVPVLLELSALTPEDRAVQLAIERLLARGGRLEELERFYEQLIARAAQAVERARLALSLANSRRRRGDVAGALAALTALSFEASTPPAALCMTALLAARTGDEPLRARALARFAASLAAPLRAVVAAIAAEALLAAGDLDAARRAADQAAHADPSLVRAAAARAAVGAVTGERWGAEAMERAMGLVVPSAALSAALTRVYDELGEPVLALAYCQRRIALCPSDLAAARDRLERTQRAGDPARLADALSWLLAQPQPLLTVAEPVAAALRSLAPLDPSRGAALARRALDVIGPRSLDLRLAVLAVADIVGERGLAIATLERWLAAGAATGERAELLVDLARRRRAAGDADGAARALLRAMREGAWGTAVLAELDVALPPRTSDGEIALLAARAEALSALSEAEQRGTARAWRELGAAYWDLAADAASAFGAWERAVRLDLETGVENFASDLLAFAGSETAIARLSDHAAKRSDPGEAARVLVVAASIALEAGRNAAALTTAARALALDPSRADVLAVAERAATEDDLDLLEELYTRLADAALGRFGVRAVHYRAARQLERRSAMKRALVHALLAFEAVPTEGAVFVTMVRLGERVGEMAEVVRGVARIAESARHPSERAAWLRRAALLADDSEEGHRLRLDILLRALAVTPTADALRELGGAAFDLVLAVPDDRELVELRLRRAAGALLPSLGGPDGARFALALARLMIEVFGASDAAADALERAVECDPELEDFAELRPFATRLAPVSADFLEKLEASTGSRASAGPALLDLGARIAEARGDRARAARWWVTAAESNPDDRELAASAEAAARALGDSALMARVVDALPFSNRAGTLLEMAAIAEQSGDFSGAIALLERARAVEGLTRADARPIVDRLRELVRRSGDNARFETLLEAEIRDELDDVERRSQLAAEFAGAVAAAGDLERALSILELALRDQPLDRGLLKEYARLARDAGDQARSIQALTGLAALPSNPAETLAVTRELAELLEQSADDVGAQARWTEVLRFDPNDVSALGALEREAERHGDYETLVGLLARRAALASNSDEVRRIRLRRAMVLEQRLGRADDARAELEALTAATGDHLSVLRVLADLNERLGAASRAAPLWLRASAVARDRAEAADLSCRACEAYLTAGDVESARRVLDGLSAWASSERVLLLAVDIERRRNSSAALADALDELASLNTLEPERRAELLLEAAHASLAADAVPEARRRAAQAARLAPKLAGAQLLHRSLEYQERGPGTADEARAAAAELWALPDDLPPDPGELRSFLLAEALSVFGDETAAEAELVRAGEMIGNRPLIALGRAERLARRGEIDVALSHYDVALAGDLVGLRSRGQVALDAAELARRADERDRSAGYLEIAAEDSGTRDAAKLLIAQLMGERAVAQASSPPPPAAEPRVREASDVHRGRYSHRPESVLAEDRVERIEIAPRNERDEHDELASSELETRPGRYSLRPEPEAATAVAERKAQADPTSAHIPKLSPRELDLYRGLTQGAVGAGKELIRELAHHPDRTHDRVQVCRRFCATVPGDRWALDRLHEAALADKNFDYARALEHVIRVFEPGSAQLEPPPLADQVEQPDAVRALLLREHTPPALEALALVWEGAEHVFRRDASTYGITGLERVPLGAPTPLARAYSTAARALGMLRTPLFQRRSAGAITVSLALLSPPAVLLSGDVRQETPELRFHLGAVMVAAMPQFSLLIGSAESQARAVLRGLAFAFGPPQRHDPNSGMVPNLAEVLWESIPARLQRRLRELCDDPALLDYAGAIGAARLATRRAGLFVCGDFGVALRELCREDGLPPATLEVSGQLTAACAENPSIRSLFLLAISAEYAQTRWHAVRGGNR